jgi:hypothetical protein
MTKLKTVNIKGKEYVEVNERLIYFRKNFPNYSLTSEVLEKTDKSILILATISNDEGKVIATGMAEEVKGSTFINKTSYVENCETSAWGRALANFGIGLDTSVASADEVKNAVANQSNAGQTEKPAKVLLELGTTNWVKAKKWIEANKNKGEASILKTLKIRYQVDDTIVKEVSVICKKKK